MTQNQVIQLKKLLEEARQLIAELDCGPWECHACADTDDIAYIEVAIDMDGTARTLADWAFALYTLAGLAHIDWSQDELYEAFRTVLTRTSPDPRQGTLPEWEEVETLMDEQARLRRIYVHLLPFLEAPAAFAEALRQKVDTLMANEGQDRVVAKANVAAEIMKALQTELEMAEGEKVTPKIRRLYQAHLETGGADIVTWFSQWLHAD